MNDIDSLAVVGVLGVIALSALFKAIPPASDHLVQLIAAGLIGYLAKATQSPQS